LSLKATLTKQLVKILKPVRKRHLGYFQVTAYDAESESSGRESESWKIRTRLRLACVRYYCTSLNSSRLCVRWVGGTDYLHYSIGRTKDCGQVYYQPQRRNAASAWEETGTSSQSWRYSRRLHWRWL